MNLALQHAGTTVRSIAFAGGCVLAIGLMAPPSALAVGFTRLEPSADQAFDLGIWYPSDAPVPQAPNTPFGQGLSMDASPAGRDLPLVIISHGNGGWMGGHADTAQALAEAGFVVGALTHSDDNVDNEGANPAAWMSSRPREISLAIDAVLKRWSDGERVRPDRVGVFGFSAGGYTALVAAGGLFDLQKATAHCEEHPAEFVCEIGLIEEIADSVDATPRESAGDSRIAAVSVAAPGFGFAFDDASLAAIGVPVQVWSGSRDARVPHDSNGRLIAEALGRHANIEVVEDAGHFSFLRPCWPGLEAAEPTVWRMICVDAVGFDRVAFHKRFDAEVVEFFSSATRR